MKVLVTTGGVACGKSRVSRVLCDAIGDGALLFSSDATVHSLLERSDVKQGVCQALGGGEWIDGEGNLDRVRMRERMLADEAARRRVEGVLHPLVFQRFHEIRREAESVGKSKVLVAEVPLFYEVGALPDADVVVVVAASPATQIERMRHHRGLSESAAIALIGAQMATMEKVSRSDRVIWNDGGIDALDAQVRLVALEFQTT